MVNSASQYLPASDKQKQTDTHRAHALENTDLTYKSKVHAVTDKALCRCTFCVVKNSMSQAAAADRAIQNRYLNAVTTQSSSEARSQNGGVLTRRQKQCADENSPQQQGREQAVNVTVMGKKRDVRHVKEVVCWRDRC